MEKFLGCGLVMVANFLDLLPSVPTAHDVIQGAAKLDVELSESYPIRTHPMPPQQHLCIPARTDPQSSTLILLILTVAIEI